MKSLAAFTAVLILAVSFPLSAYAQFGLPKRPAHPNGSAATAVPGAGDIEIVTDSGEKFRLVHTTGTNFDVVMEANGQKIGTVNPANGETTATGPDYATNGAAMSRAKAALMAGGHAHPFDPGNAGTPQTAATPPGDSGSTGTQTGSLAATVLSYDATKGEAIVQTPDGPVKFTNRGDNFEVKAMLGRQAVTLHGHYVKSDNAGDKLKNATKSLGFTVATGNVASKQLYVGPAVELYENDGLKDSPKSAFGMDGVAKDVGTQGSGLASTLQYTFEHVAVSVDAAAKAYQTASGQQLGYMQFLDKMAQQGATLPNRPSVSPH